MSYKVQFEEHHVYLLTFDSKEEFEEWDNQGGCISDLHPDDIYVQKNLTDYTPVEEAQ